MARRGGRIDRDVRAVRSIQTQMATAFTDCTWVVLVLLSFIVVFFLSPLLCICTLNDPPCYEFIAYRKKQAANFIFF